jgi:hypothetical protein
LFVVFVLDDDDTALITGSTIGVFGFSTRSCCEPNKTFFFAVDNAGLSSKLLALILLPLLLFMKLLDDDDN